ncbi:MAG: sigma-54-dependent Fis family transcriptional regulator, partial [Planctomycetes bacterium]|nr:sigma-54-dependent Fis family transcriptional regulator [Planctomycetota bacterium]
GLLDETPGVFRRYVLRYDGQLRRPTVRTAVSLIRAGAWDYLPSPLQPEVIRELVEGLAGERARITAEMERFFCEHRPPGVPIVGRSPAAVRTLEMLRTVAASRCNPVLITGETGTGKELAARAVHAWRCGPEKRFLAVNCAALSANLLESELFGHVRGAFTGADCEKTGLLEAAGDGSLFLDEISEMPRGLQAKLLRLLQERTFRKVGGTKDIPCRATIIASSNRDLPAEVQKGRFRKDLYYRLAVFPIRLVPLRHPDRRADIPLLAEYFARTSDICDGLDTAGLSAAAEEKLLAHDWPGNVRELRNAIERALILTPSGQIGPESILLDGAREPCEHTDAGQARTDPAGRDGPQAEAASRRPERTAADASPPRPEDFSLETAEREFIIRALKETGWQRTRAAALLGITRATLHAKLKRYGIQPPGPAGRAAAPSRPAQTSPAAGALQPA